MGEPALKKMSFAEYLELEEISEIKHEWLDGEIVAISGGTLEHDLLAERLSYLLQGKLSGRPCLVFGSDARNRVSATGLATYPDLSVICGRLRTDPAHPHTLTNPCLLVEVLSPSTAAWDRGEKFRHYRHLPSLCEYLLVSQDQPLLELYRRQPDDRWLYESRGPGELLQLDSVGCSLSVDEIYAVLDQMAAMSGGED